jgi:hypothetical protein
MATSLDELAKSKCPLCGQFLTNEEFHKAENSLTKLLEEEHKEELERVRKETQTTAAQKFIEELRLKDRKILEMEHNQLTRETRVIQESLKPVKEQLRMRDKQIERLQQKTELLTNQLKITQSELKGEIGEINLFESLSKAFPNDIFTRSLRGASSADIIQQIRKPNGKLIESKIIYDNKNVIALKPQDIENIKKYIEIHNTDQAIIVTQSLPKTVVKNGYFGHKDGILLVHPDIVVEVAALIRRALVKMSNLSTSLQQRETKETKLYDYIRSSEFSNEVQKIYQIYNEMCRYQDKEEKSHNTLWKERKELYESFKRIYIKISSGIDSIVEDEFPK